ncbi:hypothetical protein [Streptomyces antibioticus]|uniref:Calcium-binding protein n=1 Tax=Streptomyces antibioticus TaxID=1890 RepID=A0AAE6Y8Z1_STRAT|nr:hypothetical protein [Streptomyces antibioticus]OOQ51056.1 hypothetical protein AFM16_17720 [Streptomyces antibioticus]QIT45208.1 hypothetical protein HCX60_17995 [Streptomyces antibioticus]
MRKRAIVVAASGALALSALAVPAAQAAPTAGLNVTFSNVKVNAGKTVVVGPTTKVTVNVTYTVTKPANVSAGSFISGPVLYRGATLSEQSDSIFGDNEGTCTTSSSTVLKCTAKIQFRPDAPADYDDLGNGDAGAWKVGALAIANDASSADDMKWQSNLGTVKVQRAAKLTVDAAPEPVKKGKTITVTGKLSRANWDANKYAGYAAQSVKLQFKKKGSSTYTTVKTIKTSSTGTLKTTVKASADGYYRYSFAGTSTTPAVSAAGDFIDVN